MFMSSHVVPHSLLLVILLRIPLLLQPHVVTDGGLERVLRAMEYHLHDGFLQEVATATLHNCMAGCPDGVALVLDDSNAEDMDGLSLVIAAITHNPGNVALLDNAVSCLAAATLQPHGRSAFMHRHGLAAVAVAMDVAIGFGCVQEKALGVLANVTASPAFQCDVVRCGCLLRVYRAMDAFPGAAGVQLAALVVLTNLQRCVEAGSEVSAAETVQRLLGVLARLGGNPVIVGKACRLLCGLRQLTVAEALSPLPCAGGASANSSRGNSSSESECDVDVPSALHRVLRQREDDPDVVVAIATVLGGVCRAGGGGGTVPRVLGTPGLLADLVVCMSAHVANVCVQLTVGDVLLCMARLHDAATARVLVDAGVVPLLATAAIVHAGSVEVQRLGVGVIAALAATPRAHAALLDGGALPRLFHALSVFGSDVGVVVACVDAVARLAEVAEVVEVVVASRGVLPLVRAMGAFVGNVGVQEGVLAVLGAVGGSECGVGAVGDGACVSAVFGAMDAWSRSNAVRASEGWGCVGVVMCSLMAGVFPACFRGDVWWRCVSCVLVRGL